MLPDTKLEQESSTEEELLLEQEKNESFKFDSQFISKKTTEATTNKLKITGNIRKDLINLMSLKPEQFEFSFTGLRRLTGVHQQQLTNTLDRLLEDSVLHKTQDGYFLSPEARKTNKYSEDWEHCDHWTGKKLYPAPISIQKIYKDLYGKWFGKNRFLGGINDSKNDRITLDWVHMHHPDQQTRLEVSSTKADVKFRGQISTFDKDKALNVFSETFISVNNPIMFENEASYVNN